MRHCCQDIDHLNIAIATILKSKITPNCSGDSIAAIIYFLMLKWMVQLP